MRRSQVFIIIICLIILPVFIVNEVSADRGIRVKQMADLSHGSGRLGDYKALIIGIDDYKSDQIPDLETAVNDAKAMAEILKTKYGFKTQLLLNREATREAIYGNLRRLAASTKPDDSVLIYFAGHGDLDRTYNDGWWIPADAIPGNPVTYFENVQVQKAMRSMKARHVLLISDSCYSGTLFGKARSMPPVIDDKYYLNLINEKSRWGMTSGNKTPVSDRGTGGHSVFAHQLIKELKNNHKPFLSTQEIYTRIAPVIANNSEQTPLCRPIINTGDQGGEFVFVASQKKPAIPRVSNNQIKTMDKEVLFWQSIQDSKSPALFQAYLEAFPNGLFAPIAREKIASSKGDDAIGSIPLEKTKSRLFIQVEPGDARIRILNIRPRFHQGMALDPGRYQVEVTSAGYETKKVWVKLTAGRDETLRFNLEQKTVKKYQTSINKSQDAVPSKSNGKVLGTKNLKQPESVTRYKVSQYLPGNWKMVVNIKYQFTLMIRIKGQEISGKMICTNYREPVDGISGKISSNGSVEFYRHRPGKWVQKYEGNLTMEKSKLIMKGYGYHDGIGQFMWYAEKEMPQETRSHSE